MNIGRQLFTPHDLGENKAVNSLTKINRAFGLQWEGIPMEAMTFGDDLMSNIIVTCVDNAKYRTALSETLRHPHIGPEYSTMFYWLDIGNSRDTGQFVLGSLFEENRKVDDGAIEPVGKLRTITDLFPDLEQHDSPARQGRGCAYADRLMEQSLFINDVLVAHASDCLFRLLSHRQLSVHGGFVNLKTGTVNPIKV
jgi:PRTRC genetic system ThiF family protein